MFAHIWRMRARKKRVEEYEKFARQVTLPTLKRLEGCEGAHFLKTFQARKPEYLWVVFWKDEKALEKARASSLWREQIKHFEAGKFYKSIPLELVCEELETFAAAAPKPRPAAKPPAARKAPKTVKPQSNGAPAEKPNAADSADEASAESTAV